MSSEIEKMYEDVMAGVKTASDQTAEDTNADDGPQFDKAFFEKVAAGEEEAVGAINEFIAEATEAGHSEEEIEEAIGEAMQDVGYDADEEPAAVEEPETDEYEQAKMSAYIDGCDKAVEDVLASDQVKEAGITAEDLFEYELGQHHGAGYIETRQVLDEAIEKIAEQKKEAKAKAGKVRALGSSIMKQIKDVGGGYSGLATMARSPREAASALKESLKRQGLKGTIKGSHKELKALGTTAAGAGAGYGAYRAAKSKKDKK